MYLHKTKLDSTLFYRFIRRVKFFKENLQVFKAALVPLFILVVLSSNIDQYLNLRVESSLRDPMGASSSLYIFGFLSLVSGTVFPLILATLCLYALSTLENWKSGIGTFFERFFNHICIETLRAWGKTLAWSLLFILPGIWKFLEYSLVPFVVTGSKEYDQGREDALKTSSLIVRRHWGKIIGVFLCFHLFLPLIFTSLFDAYRLIWKTPIASLTLNLIDTYLLVLSTQILFRIFRREVAPDESHV